MDRPPGGDYCFLKVEEVDAEELISIIYEERTNNITMVPHPTLVGSNPTHLLLVEKKC